MATFFKSQPDQSNRSSSEDLEPSYLFAASRTLSTYEGSSAEGEFQLAPASRSMTVTTAASEGEFKLIQPCPTYTAKTSVPTVFESLEEAASSFEAQPTRVPTMAMTAGDVYAFELPELQPWDPSRFKFASIFKAAGKLRKNQLEIHEDLAENRQVLVKRFPAQQLLETGELENPLQEIDLTLRFSDPGFKGAAGAWARAFRDEVTRDALLVTDWTRGDLFSFALSVTATGLERETIMYPILVSLLRAICRLHQAGMSHGAINVETAIVVDNPKGGLEVMLTDFAQAFPVGRLCSALRNKALYRPPEASEAGNIYDTRAADLFAAGVVGYTIVIGRFPWMSTAPGADKAFSFAMSNGIDKFFRRCIVSTKPEKISAAQSMSKQYRGILTGLLSMDPSIRLEAAVELSSSL